MVEGAVSAKSARRIAMSIANSPLVKTAIAGEDANWGRVVMAVGKAGEPADRDRLSIWFNGIRVAHKGMRDPDYDEAEVSAAMKQQIIELKVGARHRRRPRPRAHLRSHQGVYRHQWRLPLLNGCGKIAWRTLLDSGFACCPAPRNDRSIRSDRECRQSDRTATTMR